MNVTKDTMNLRNGDLLEEIETLEDDLGYYQDQIVSMEKMIDELKVRQTRDGARFHLLMEEAKHRKSSGRLE